MAAHGDQRLERLGHALAMAQNRARQATERARVYERVLQRFLGAEEMAELRRARTESVAAPVDATWQLIRSRDAAGLPPSLLPPLPPDDDGPDEPLSLSGVRELAPEGSLQERVADAAARALQTAPAPPPPAPAQGPQGPGPQHVWWVVLGLVAGLAVGGTLAARHQRARVAQKDSEIKGLLSTVAGLYRELKLRALQQQEEALGWAGPQLGLGGGALVDYYL